MRCTQTWPITVAGCSRNIVSLHGRLFRPNHQAEDTRTQSRVKKNVIKCALHLISSRTNVPSFCQPTRIACPAEVSPLREQQPSPLSFASTAFPSLLASSSPLPLDCHERRPGTVGWCEVLDSCKEVARLIDVSGAQMPGRCGQAEGHEAK